MSGGSPVHMPSRTEALLLRGVRYNIRRWGSDAARPILFLHGTQDSSITFQFVVEQLRGDWCVIAPDWRGHGGSQWVSQGYWLHEFVADLDALADTLFAGAAVPIVGHSLGGNIASIFAGLKPDRLTHLISLDGFGPLTSLVPVDVRQILSRMLSLRTQTRQHASYPSVEDMAMRLARGNPRLNADQATFLALHASRSDGEGARRWLFDPAHQMSLPSLHTMDEWYRIWAGIKAPVLWISSNDTRPHAAVSVPGELARRAAHMPGVRRVPIPDTGHNLHHDEPGRVAELIERFIAEPAAPINGEHRVDPLGG